MKTLDQYTEEELREALGKKVDERLHKQEKERNALITNLLPLTPEKYLSVKHPDSDNKLFHKESRKFLMQYDRKGVCPYSAGYWVNTLQQAVSVRMYKEVPFEDQLGVLDFLPFIELTTPERESEDLPRPHKKVSISEPSLSEFGIWWLAVFDDETASIMQTVYGRNYLESKHTNVEDALKYIYKKLSYGDRD